MGEIASARLEDLIAVIPYVKFLGMSVEFAGEELTGVLPFSAHLIGNTRLPALHGGVLGAFLEMTALAQLMVLEPVRRQPRTIDVTIEYLRPGRPMSTWAKADVRKIGRRIANVHVEAWQDRRSAPVAALRGHFLLSPAAEPTGAAKAS
ncbi:MAG: PaaI family thioesterase [Caulobacteraceae bacterium]